MENTIKCLIAAALLMGTSAPAAQAQSPRLDPSFAITSALDSAGRASISEMVLQPDGKLVVYGSFYEINGRPAPGLARLLPDGRVDTTFAAPLFNGLVDALALQADGKLLVGGRFITVGGQSRIGLARLLASGRLDFGFLSPFGSGPPPNPAYSSVRRIVLQPGKGVLVLGTMVPLGSSGIGGFFAARLSEATGTRDTTFRLPANVVRNIVNDVLVLPTGHLVFSGRPNLFNGQPCPVWGALPDGANDPSFVPLPGINTYSDARDLARDPATGNLYVVRAGGRVLSFEPVRLLPNGVLDPTFRVAGSFGPSFSVAGSMAVQPNGRLLLGGDFSVAGGLFGSVRLLPSGALDPSYDPSLGPGRGSVSRVLVQPDGKLLFAGGFADAGGFALTALARMLDPNVLLAARAGASEADELAAWPVPAHDVLHLGLPAGRAGRQATLLDALGRVVLRQALAPGAAAPALPTAGLAPGAYLLRVDFASGPPAYRRVAVE